MRARSAAKALLQQTISRSPDDFRTSERLSLTTNVRSVALVEQRKLQRALTRRQSLDGGRPERRQPVEPGGREVFPDPRLGNLIGIRRTKSVSQTIYDPTCGFGSLLLKARSESPVGITVYGQEKDVATRALAKMNMVLHDCPEAEIMRDNTLSSPQFRNKDQSLTKDIRLRCRQSAVFRQGLDNRRLARKR